MLWRTYFRHTGTGLFVTAAFAKAHPDETVKERRWLWQRKP